jgi:hypothetical protein
MRIPYYGIYLPNHGSLEMYNLVNATYERMTPNARGHYEITPMQVELEVWEGACQNQPMQWLRWWDLQGNLLPTGQEIAQQALEEKEQALEEKEQALEAREQPLEARDQERLNRQRLAEKLRSLTSEQLTDLGISIDELE